MRKFALSKYINESAILNIDTDTLLSLYQLLISLRKKNTFLLALALVLVIPVRVLTLKYIIAGKFSKKLFLYNRYWYTTYFECVENVKNYCLYFFASFET